MTAPYRFSFAFADREATISIDDDPTSDAVRLEITGGPEVPSSVALTIAIALERASVIVGQRRAAHRDREMARREREHMRRALLAAQVKP